MKKVIPFLKSFYSSDAATFLLLLAGWSAIFNDYSGLYKELLIMVLLGLFIRLVFKRYPFSRKSTSCSDHNESKIIAKRDLMFFVKTFFLLSIGYFLLYKFVWSVIFNVPDTDPYKQIYISIFFGIFFG
jgi:predicted MFS family arabinose efflux permease